jgi:hypothetical protein
LLILSIVPTLIEEISANIFSSGSMILSSVAVIVRKPEDAPTGMEIMLLVELVKFEIV